MQLIENYGAECIYEDEWSPYRVWGKYLLINCKLYN